MPDGPKRRSYDDDYAPDYHAAERQPEYFSPRPNLTQASEAVEATVNGSTPTRGSDTARGVAGGPDAFLPARALEMAGHSTLPDGARVKVIAGAEGPSGRRSRPGGRQHRAGAHQG